MDELEKLMRKTILEYVRQYNFNGLLMLIEETFNDEADLLQIYCDNIKKIREGLG